MTACELIEFLAKNVAQLGDMPVYIVYKNGVKYTKIEDIKFTVNIDHNGDSEIILKENNQLIILKEDHGSN